MLAQRFACTQCGLCCNRAPEVELSEAAALADVFVFRLMLLLHRLPRGLGEYRKRHPQLENAAETYFEHKRFVTAYAAHKRPVRTRGPDGGVVEETEYLMLTALTLDRGTGRCSALEGTRCGIYERRPFACRTVPLHYTAAEAGAARDLAAFVATPGYACETGDGAPVVLEAGRIADPQMRQARADALAMAHADARWKQAIVQRMKPGAAGGLPLPTLAQVEANAARGALTTSMRAAWQVAVDAGLMAAADGRALVQAQLAVIERELALGSAAPEPRQTLLEMRTEYRHALGL